jgi:hypothetical protein
MESALQRVAMSGQVSDRLLRTLGLSTDKLAQSMGMSAEEAKKAFEAMTPEERIAAITKAMGDGTEANEMYKNSYAGLKDRANAAMAGLAGAVGQAILPIVIPALEAATNFVKLLTDGFKSLPGPVQGAIGAVLGIVAIGTTDNAPVGHSTSHTSQWTQYVVLKRIFFKRLMRITSPPVSPNSKERESSLKYCILNV